MFRNKIQNILCQQHHKKNTVIFWDMIVCTDVLVEHVSNFTLTLKIKIARFPEILVLITSDHIRDTHCDEHFTSHYKKSLVWTNVVHGKQSKKIQISHICLLERLKTSWKEPSERIYKKWAGKEQTKIQEVCVYENREKQRMLGHDK